MNIKRIDKNRILIPIGYVEGMRVPGIIFIDEELEKYLEEDAIRQVANVATLPGIVKASYAMPDIHTGYGFAIGGVAAFRMDEGIISPGGVGYDINCGVRLLRSNLVKDEVITKIRELVEVIFNEIPSGVGSKGKLKLSKDDECKLMIKGAKWAVENGFGESEDLKHIESGGCLEGADPSLISEKAYERGRTQQGTLGSGNHFLEIQYVEEIYDKDSADALGLFPEQITVMIHTGSRGFGHQVCTDFIDIMTKAAKKYDIFLPDRELACAPINSVEGQQYFSAMKAAANYAWANRQCIMHWTREAFMKVFKISPRDLGMSLIYDVAHNIAKVEEHIIDGEKIKLMVHRKGATRAFPPGHPELPEAFKNIGQPVLIPGDMGRASYVLLGTKEGMEETFGSTCHGAGRVLSRHQAIKKAKGRSIKKEMEEIGIIVRSAGKETLAEEMSEAYKDINNVVKVVHNAGISKKVAKLRPIGVVKG
jgi:tRNA-splicing ligase RtcB